MNQQTKIAVAMVAGVAPEAKISERKEVGEDLEQVGLRLRDDDRGEEQRAAPWPTTSLNQECNQPS